MSAALPPVTDCGCSTVAATPAAATDCCPRTGLNDPNVDGLVPSDPTRWIDYWQLADLVQGPVIQTWYWNPNLALWQ